MAVLNCILPILGGPVIISVTSIPLHNAVTVMLFCTRTLRCRPVYYVHGGFLLPGRIRAANFRERMAAGMVRILAALCVLFRRYPASFQSHRDHQFVVSLVYRITRFLLSDFIVFTSVYAEISLPQR